jgi:hypothetical protein
MAYSLAETDVNESSIILLYNFEPTISTYVSVLFKSYFHSLPY